MCRYIDTNARVAGARRVTRSQACSPLVYLCVRQPDRLHTHALYMYCYVLGAKEPGEGYVRGSAVHNISAFIYYIRGEE